jgi:hypothetical protein
MDQSYSKSMLESEQKSQDNRHSILKTKKWSSLLGFLHEWKIRLEQEGCISVSHSVTTSNLALPVLTTTHHNRTIQ